MEAVQISDFPDGLRTFLGQVFQIYYFSEQNKDSFSELLNEESYLNPRFDCVVTTLKLKSALEANVALKSPKLQFRKCTQKNLSSTQNIH